MTSGVVLQGVKYTLSFVRNRRESRNLHEGHSYFKNVKVHAAMKQKEVELWTCK